MTKSYRKTLFMGTPEETAEKNKVMTYIPKVGVVRLYSILTWYRICPLLSITTIHDLLPSLPN